jgi:hypothetical protein
MDEQQDDSTRQDGGRSPETVYIERSSTESVTAESVEMNRSAAKSVKAGTVSMERSAAALLTADSATLKYSAAAVTYARGQADLSWASPKLVGAGGDVTIKNGGAQFVAAANSVSIRNGGAAAVVARTARVEGGTVGLLLAGQADIDENARVILRPTGAAALGAGFAGGLFLALVFLWRLFAAGGKRRRLWGKKD